MLIARRAAEPGIVPQFPQKRTSPAKGISKLLPTLGFGTTSVSLGRRRPRRGGFCRIPRRDGTKPRRCREHEATPPFPEPRLLVPHPTFKLAMRRRRPSGRCRCSPASNVRRARAGAHRTPFGPGDSEFRRFRFRAKRGASSARPMPASTQPFQSGRGDCPPLDSCALALAIAARTSKAQDHLACPRARSAGSPITPSWSQEE